MTSLSLLLFLVLFMLSLAILIPACLYIALAPPTWLPWVHWAHNLIFIFRYLFLVLEVFPIRACSTFPLQIDFSYVCWYTSSISLSHWSNDIHWLLYLNSCICTLSWVLDLHVHVRIIALKNFCLLFTNHKIAKL